jgi:hypothetical protein
MTDIDQLLTETASIIADYRDGEITQPGAGHVKKWLAQFDEGVREPLITELNHVLRQTYIPKMKVEQFLAALVKNEKLTGGQPKDFWKGAKFLDLQQRGGSQGELISLIEQPLKAETGHSVVQCGVKDPACFVYLDDGLFTGNTIINDLTKWLKAAAPTKALVHVIVIALHLGGQY